MQGLDQRFQMRYVHIVLPNWKSDLKESKESVCIRLNFKANAFEHGLNGLDALKDKDAEGVVRKRALAPDKTN